MNSDMDAVMAYRNYLAAEDHLEELIRHASTSEEKAKLEQMEADTIYLRDHVMPPEADSFKHCLVKHYSAAYEGMREKWKANRTEELREQKQIAYDLLIDALEMLWGRKINVCERCTHGDERNSASSGTDTEGGTGHGQPRGSVQTASSSGICLIPSLQETGAMGSEISVSGGTAGDGEEGDITFFDGDSFGEIHSAGGGDSGTRHRGRKS